MSEQNSPPPGAARSFEFVVSLIGTAVTVERRILVPEYSALDDLHRVIQAAMGWTDAHLHEFTVPDGTQYGDPDLEDLDFADESTALLRDLLHRPGDTLRYMYDFGDFWEHRVELAAIRAAGAADGLACIDGRGACPPEDCGGVSGYQELCEALADPAAPRHEELAEWAASVTGGPFDPLAFDLDAANNAVRGLAGRHGLGPVRGGASEPPQRGSTQVPGRHRLRPITGPVTPAAAPRSTGRSDPAAADAASSAGGPAGEARRLLAERLDRLAGAEALGLSAALADHYLSNATLEPPGVDDLMLWGFYPEDALGLAAAAVAELADRLRGHALTPGAQAPRLAARGAETLAERLSEAGARLDADPVASSQRRLAAICGEAGLVEPAIADLAFHLEDSYALGGPIETSPADRGDALFDPHALAIRTAGVQRARSAAVRSGRPPRIRAHGRGSV